MVRNSLTTIDPGVMVHVGYRLRAIPFNRSVPDWVVGHYTPDELAEATRAMLREDKRGRQRGSGGWFCTLCKVYEVTEDTTYKEGD